MKYKDAGVNIDQAAGLVGKIKRLAKTTAVPGVLGDIGLFAGFFSLAEAGFRDPVLVSGTDGVGTKILLAELLGTYDTIGIDLVAMSVNDILTCGAKPLFFLDYLALGRIDGRRDPAILKGVVDGCRQAGCALLGGETAQMADVYGRKGFDLAGFAVGAVDRQKIIDGRKIKPGDVILGLPSSGLHSNGFSLVRKVFSGRELLAERKKLGLQVLTPTRIYVKTVLETVAGYQVKGIAHITGGGLKENVPRILPKGTRAVVRRNAWPVPEIFQRIRKQGRVSQPEMDRTFNLGIGLVLIASVPEAEKISCFLTGRREKVYQLGRIEKTGAAPALDFV